MNAESTLPRPGYVSGRSRTVLLWAGRAVLLLWAAFWLWFNVASFFGEVAEYGIGAWINHALLAVVILTGTILPFVRPRLGGAFLIALAVGLGIFFRGVTPFVFLIFVLPPAVAGVLTLLTARRTPSPDVSR